ncbi:recombinase RecT [Salinisphaera sp. G21_0]|uniref:recombinase RecT n=1 Tax=Salinisphaera sp. G21_0 TaxID=2821094 RepID=UPI001ADD1125|nr:recombinase RecT [Salinisphaera sp. G21_0]MBO9484330.1 recombinase RecT [Salinisphaera sp. G21_0]
MQQVANIQTPEQVIEAKQQDFIKIAEKDQLVHWQEESQFALQAWYKSEMLQKCSPVSIQNAIINVAACGLTLNPANGFAYLVPEYDKSTNQQVCQLRISFKGLMKVAVDSGAIDYVKAEIVREKDTFEYLGPCEKPVHKMNPFTDRGEVVGVYCIAKTGKGDFLCDVMSKTEIDKIKSKAKTQFVWNDWYEEMAKKAIIKRASKQWPAAGNAQRFRETVKRIDEVEGNEREIGGEVVNVHAPDQPALPDYYKQDDFNRLFPSWEKAIQSGKKTPQALIAMVETKGKDLTDEQKAQIQGVQ